MNVANKIPLILAVIFFLIVPILAEGISSYYTHILILVLYYSILAISWNLLFGFTGQISFAHAALAGIGGYASAFFVLGTNISIIIGVIVGGLMAMLLSLLIGLVSLRLRGYYFALATIGLAETARLIFTIEYPYTRGELGLPVPPIFLGATNFQYYYLFLALFSIFVFSTYKLTRSRGGFFLRAIREDEDAASALGIDTHRWKTISFCLSGFMAGVAGAFFAHFVGIIIPRSMGLSEMFLIVAIVMIGGAGTLVGPILGSFLVVISSEYLRANYGEYHLIIFAIILIILQRYFREGVSVLLKRVVKFLK
jgi:branched-chain amino acid transport system permease protein